MFELTPDQFNESLDELIMFLAQVMAFTLVMVTRVHVVDLGGEVLPGGAVHLPQLPCLPPRAPLHSASPQHAPFDMPRSYPPQVDAVFTSFISSSIEVLLIGQNFFQEQVLDRAFSVA